MLEIHTRDGSFAWVPEYEFFLITHIDGSDDNKLSGVIGFGVPQTPQEDEPTESFIQALVDNYQIEDSTFSLYICDDSDPD